MKKILILLVPLLFINIACENETSETKINNVTFESLKVKDSRLYFESKEEFKIFLERIDKMPENIVMTEINKNMYSKDFYSLMPIINEKNIEQINRHINTIKNRLGRVNTLIDNQDIIDNFDDIEDIFGESYFANFLNQNSEIQIGGKVFKYTDKGLLISDLVNIEDLYEFMDENNVHSLNDILNQNIEEEYPAFNFDGGYKTVTPKVDSYLAAKLQAPEDNSSEGSWVPSSGNGPLAPSQNLNQAIDALQVCSGTKPWLGNLFGTTRVCIDKYENNRRVKVKYYNVDFFLGYAIGVKVKHQKKGTFGIWSKEDTEQVAMGVNSLTWFFDHSKIFNNTANSMTVNYYTHDGRLYSSQDAYTSAVYVDQNKPLPNLPFSDDVDIIIEWANHSFGSNLTEPQVRNLFYQGLFNGAETILNQLNRNMNKVAVVMNQNGQSIVQYYDFSNSCSNCSKREKIFDFGFVSPQITYNFGVGNGGSFNNLGFSDLKFDFKHPDITNMSMYGMAKHNGVWHGIKMVF